MAKNGKNVSPIRIFVIAASFGLIILSWGYLIAAWVIHKRVVRRRVADADLVRGLGGTWAETDNFQRALIFQSVAAYWANEKLHRTARAQSALRRVATVVARGVSPQETFRIVAEEMGCLLGADHIAIQRFEPDDSVTVVGHWSSSDAPKIMPPAEGHWPSEKDTVGEVVRRTGKPARMKLTEEVTTKIGSWLWSHGIRYVVSCPIIVESRIWGTMTVLAHSIEPPLEVTEARLVEFVELVSTAITNGETSAKLIASRSRIITASDEARHRIERNLHDGAQQRLVSALLKVRAAQASTTGDGAPLQNELREIGQDLTDAIDELREISHGLRPMALARHGLDSTIHSLIRRSTTPAQLEIDIKGRLPERIETTIYYIVSEALTNIAKHACASMTRIDLRQDNENIRLSIEDDGIGGADANSGSGLIGLVDRIESLGGIIQIVSPPKKGTSLLIQLPSEQPPVLWKP